MKYKAVGGVLLGVLAALTLSGPTTAQDGDVFSCPAGTTFNYKVDNLSGFTFTVPTPPVGWTVTAVIIKVGGPEGGSHITFTPVTPGQVLSVANQQYAISHVHVCKSNRPPVTTTSTTSTTTTTTLPPTTTTICVDCTPNTQIGPTTTTTTAPPPGDDDSGTTTTTVAPAEPTTTTTLSPAGGATTTTPTTAPITNPTNPPTPPTTVAPPTGNLPSTGTDANMAVIAITLIGIGAVLLRLVSKRS